jgi:hypothetical protein
VAIAVLVAATTFGVLWRRGQGRIRRVGAAGESGAVTLLLFTTPACSSCKQVREICATVDRARYQEVDASVEVERARAFDVWRAPTLFVLDNAGTPVWRTTGVPKRADLEAAVAAVNP